MNTKGYIEKCYDKEFRAKLIADPKGHVNELYGDTVAAEGIEFSVSVSTKEMLYIAIPHHDSVLELDAENIQAAGCTGSASSILTAGCAGTACTTFSSASTAGSAGTAGSA